MKKVLSRSFAFLLLIFLSGSYAFAAGGNAAWGEAGADGSRPELAKNGNFRDSAIQVINYFLGFLGLLAVVMIIYAGIMMVTAQGEEEQINKGKKMITWAAIGLIIIMLSFVIVKAVLGAGN